jgi:hypothetical protein
MKLGWILSILKKQLDDKLHSGGNLTFTRVLDCPRKILIQDWLPVFYDVRNANTPHVGTTMHKEIEENTIPGNYTEVEIPIEGKPKPVIFGMEIKGKVDEIANDVSWIEETKFHGDKSQSFKVQRGKLVDDDLIVQLNEHRMAVEQTFEMPGVVKRLWCWHGAMTTVGKEAWYHVEVPIRDEAWCLNAKPKDGKTTVQQIVEIYKDAFARKEAGENPETICASLPLIGEDFYPDWKTGIGRGCDYCPSGVKDVCQRMASGGGGADWSMTQEN